MNLEYATQSTLDTPTIDCSHPTDLFAADLGLHDRGGSANSAAISHLFIGSEGVLIQDQLPYIFLGLTHLIFVRPLISERIVTM